MKFRYLLMLTLMGHIGWAQAAIYKYVSPDGHVTYSSEPIKGGKKLKLGPLPTTKPFRATGQEEFRVKQAEQKRRDEERRRILEDELAAEQKQLDDARQKLQDEQDNPGVYHKTIVVGSKVIGHNKDGSPITAPITQTITRRNVAGHEARVKAAQDDVTLHEKNIKALKAELSRIK